MDAQAAAQLALGGGGHGHSQDVDRPRVGRGALGGQDRVGALDTGDAERLAAKDAVAQASSDDHYSPAKVAFVEFCVRQCVANSDLVASRMGIKYKC